MKSQTYGALTPSMKPTLKAPAKAVKGKASQPHKNLGKFLHPRKSR